MDDSPILYDVVFCLSQAFGLASCLLQVVNVITSLHPSYRMILMIPPPQGVWHKYGGRVRRDS